MDNDDKQWHQSQFQDNLNQAYTNSRKRSYGLLQALIDAWGTPKAEENAPEETDEERMKRLLAGSGRDIL